MVRSEFSTLPGMINWSPLVHLGKHTMGLSNKNLTFPFHSVILLTVKLFLEISSLYFGHNNLELCVSGQNLKILYIEMGDYSLRILNNSTRVVKI